MDAPTWAEIEPFLDDALETAPEEREAWLTALEAQHPQIVHVLRGLLRERDELDARGFLSQPIELPAERQLTGVNMGAYTIRAAIGRGGMGEVWLAERSDGRFEGRFAIKLLDVYGASKLGLDRFRREGRLLARLAHEHIARLIDAGVTDDARPYLVLEYIEGERIDRYCDSHALTVAGRVGLLLDVLAAVAHAHANLIVHRDIKPSNVLVTQRGSAKLLDFGIAKLVSGDQATDGESAPTRVEDAALTPEYAAPEQILGEPASTATDVYQLGVLLFVLLAGRLPLLSTGSSRAERIKAALDGEPMRLSDAAPAPLRTQLRGDLDAIVAKAMRKLPRERYATAAALADDLRRYLKHEPVTARADVFSYRLAKFTRRYRSAVLGSSLAALALIAAATFALLQMREAQRQRDASREQARLAERQAEFVTLMMATVGDRPTSAAELFSAGERLLDAHYPNDPKFRANALVNLSIRYSDIGESTKYEELTRKAAAIADELRDPLLRSRTECALAVVDLQAGRLEVGQSHLQEGQRMLALLADPDVAYIADCLETQAEFEDVSRRGDEAIRTDLQALTLLEKAKAQTDERYPSLLGRISDFYKEQGDSHNGYEYARRALESLAANGQTDSDAYLTMGHNLASSLFGFGELKEGCEREREVISRFKASGRHPVPAMTASYGGCLLKFGRPAEALDWFDACLASADAGQEVQLKLFARFTRARALLTLRRFAEAHEAFQQVDTLGRQDPVSLRDMLLRSQLPRAELLLAEDRAPEARRLLDELLMRLRGDDKSSGRLLPPALLWSARVAVAQRRFSDAERFARECLQLNLARSRSADSSGDVGEAALVLAQALQGAGDAAAARQSAEQALRSLVSQYGEESPTAQQARALLVS